MKLIYDNNIDGYNFKVYTKTPPVFIDHCELDDDENEDCIFLIEVYNILGKITSFNIDGISIKRLCEMYNIIHKYNNTLFIKSDSKIDLIDCSVIFNSINRHILLIKNDYVIIIDGLLSDLQNILLKEI